MELWIRSQKNDEVGIVPRLIKATDIVLDYCGENDSYYISANDCIELAYYQTEERALEVLDEIQSILMPKIMAYNPLVESKEDYQNHNMKTELVGYTTEYDVFALQTYVYEMPKE